MADDITPEWMDVGSVEKSINELKALLNIDPDEPKSVADIDKVVEQNRQAAEGRGIVHE